MIPALVIAGLWFAAALALCGRATAPAAWALAATGIPMLGLLTWQGGPLPGLVGLGGALLLLLRTVRQRARRELR
ncbi:DUF2484 family protein [Falsirhodobacter deserti]|uniref:DUF2484 family protein n=1 Tax=Falsirhodobacter deserti TaxID=1365611 RepID=UPI000FE3724C|nr:DUF2484 family protein [Falsirhodobacter deserti]